MFVCLFARGLADEPSGTSEHSTILTCRTINERIGKHMGGSDRDSLRYCPGTCLEGQRESMEKLVIPNSWIEV